MTEGRVIELSAEAAGQRLDKALSAVLPDISRARLQALIAEGRLSLEGAVLTDASAKAAPGSYRLELPAPRLPG